MLKKLRRHIGTYPDLWLIFLLGILIRIQHVIVTRYTELAYDWNGHLQYVLHALETFRIPAYSAGWEMHQAPLYYYLSALWVRRHFGEGPFVGMPEDLQLLSLSLSVAALAVAFSMALSIFPGKKYEREQVIFLGIVATLPGIVFFSSRISNDALVLPLLFLFTALLLQWWKSGGTRDWVMCSVIVGLCFLTKFNAGVSSALALVVCMVIRNRGNLRNGLLSFSWFAVIVTVIAGWYLGIRIAEGYFTDVFFRPGPAVLGLGRGLWLPFQWEDFLSFSPVRMLSTTFNHTWIDSYGRQYFFEFFAKSALFGEWPFSRLLWLGRGLLLTELLTIGFAAVGAVIALRKKRWFGIPLLVTFITATGMLLSYRILHNTASNQDFRFVPHVILPVAVFACDALGSLRGTWKTTATLVLILFPILSGVFVLLIPFAL